MKFAMFAVCMAALFSLFVFAQTPTPAPSDTPSVFTAPLPSPTPTAIAVTPIAPPTWVTDLLATIEKLPIIGPYVSKILVYLAALSMMLTSLVAFAVGLLKSLSGLFAQFPQLQSWSAALEEFQDGKIMYWLKFFSNFNAQKPDSPPTTPA